MQYSVSNNFNNAHNWRTRMNNSILNIDAIDINEDQMLIDLKNSVNTPGHKEKMDEAICYIYKKYGFKLMSVIVKKLPNLDPEEILQIFMLDLPRKLLMFKMQSNIFTYLYRIIVNIAFMQLRLNRNKYEKCFASISFDTGGYFSHRPMSGSSDEQIWRDYPDISQNIDSGLLKDGVVSIDLARAIHKLPPGYKKIFILHDIYGYEHHEIAKLLDISENTSKSQLRKARYKLRDLLNEIK